MTEPTYAVPNMQLATSSKQNRDIQKLVQDQIDKAKAQLNELHTIKIKHERKADQEESDIYLDWAIRQLVEAGITEKLVLRYQGKTVELGEPFFRCDRDYTWSPDKKQYYKHVTMRSRYSDHLATFKIDENTNEILESSINFPRSATHLPAGLSYPTRKAITSRLRAASIKLGDEAGFGVTWNYVSTTYNQQGRIGAESLVDSMAYTLNNADDLRQMVWHKNRCSALAEVLEKKGMIDSWEYEPETDKRWVKQPSGESAYADMIVGYRGVFHFKMSPEGGI